jgi:ribosomal protein L14E/L6E/L27E
MKAVGSDVIGAVRSQINVEEIIPKISNSITNNHTVAVIYTWKKWHVPWAAHNVPSWKICPLFLEAPPVLFSLPLSTAPANYLVFYFPFCFLFFFFGIYMAGRVGGPSIFFSLSIVIVRAQMNRIEHNLNRVELTRNKIKSSKGSNLTKIKPNRVELTRNKIKSSKGSNLTKIKPYWLKLKLRSSSKHAQSL